MSVERGPDCAGLHEKGETNNQARIGSDKGAIHHMQKALKKIRMV